MQTARISATIAGDLDGELWRPDVAARGRGVGDQRDVIVGQRLKPRQAVREQRLHGQLPARVFRAGVEPAPVDLPVRVPGAQEHLAQRGQSTSSRAVRGRDGRRAEGGRFGGVVEQAVAGGEARVQQETHGHDVLGGLDEGGGAGHRQRRKRDGRGRGRAGSSREAERGDHLAAGSTMSTMRRLAARPSGLSLPLAGRNSPKPEAVSCRGSSPGARADSAPRPWREQR